MVVEEGKPVGVITRHDLLGYSCPRNCRGPLSKYAASVPNAVDSSGFSVIVISLCVS